MKIYKSFLSLALLLVSNCVLSQEVQNDIKVVEVKIEETSLKDKLAKSLNIDSFQIEYIVIEKNKKLYNCIGTGSGIKCRKIDSK